MREDGDMCTERYHEEFWMGNEMGFGIVLSSGLHLDRRSGIGRAYKHCIDEFMTSNAYLQNSNLKFLLVINAIKQDHAAFPHDKPLQVG